MEVLDELSKSELCRRVCEHAGHDYGRLFHLCDIPWSAKLFAGKLKFVRNLVAGPGPVYWHSGLTDPTPGRKRCSTHHYLAPSLGR